MAVTVGSARSDENGKAYNGKAGDQKSGKEVSTQSWYKHPKGWRVFRAKDPEKAAKIAACMKAACANEKIGYDQYQRNTLYTQAEKVGFDVSRVTTACETDCSALVRVCCAYAGIMGLPSGFRTGNMPSNLLATGAFVELKGSKYTDDDDFLGAGDILVTKTSGHTVVALTNGPKYEGTVEAKEYDFGERILKKGTEGVDVKLMQEYLLKLGYDLGSYGADGDFGSATEKALKAFQAERGLEADGEYGPKSHAAMLLALEALNEVPAPTPEPVGDLKVKGGSWNVRTGPGTAYPTAGIVRGGDTLTRLTVENWIPVLYNGEPMYISKNAVEGG